jgi:hypothetical protein
MYKIIGIYRGKKEVIDTAKDLTEANYLVNEYRMAYGPTWTIYYK